MNEADILYYLGVNEKKINWLSPTEVDKYVQTRARGCHRESDLFKLKLKQVAPKLVDDPLNFVGNTEYRVARIDYRDISKKGWTKFFVSYHSKFHGPDKSLYLLFGHTAKNGSFLHNAFVAGPDDIDRKTKTYLPQLFKPRDVY